MSQADVITQLDGKPLAIAVICEKWTNGAESLDTHIQVTTPADALISKITTECPQSFSLKIGRRGLGERQGGPEEVKPVLRTFEEDGSWTMA